MLSSRIQLPIRAALTNSSQYAGLLSTSWMRRADAVPSMAESRRVPEGQRYASVKAQGAYKLKNKKTMAKKLGAKRVGEQYVLPGTIIYKQRGTLWFAGENAVLGRNHSIHAAVAGYVKYYRDPNKHPDRQYIGVTLNRNDILPIPPSAPRQRRLAKVAVPMKPRPVMEALNRSGIPRLVIRRPGVIELGPEDDISKAEAQSAIVDAAEAAANKDNEDTTRNTSSRNQNKPTNRVARRWNAYVRIKRANRMLFLRDNYAYRESNFQLGRLMGKHKGKTPGTQLLGSRHKILRHRRRERDTKIRQVREIEKQQKEMASRPAKGSKSKKNKKAKKEKAAN